MAIASALLCVAVLCLFQGSAWAHTYHLGNCPIVEPQPDFEMSKLLGKWYAIQKTSTGSRCLVYNFTASSEPGEYYVEQVSEHPVLGLANVDNKYHYKGQLSVPHPEMPGKMIVRFPLSVAGSASYVVFYTDYEQYAGIFTCQKLAFANRQSATILSRTKTLEKQYVDKIRSKLSAYGVDPFDLSVIDQKNCPAEDTETRVNINIDDNTFSPSNIAGVVRKAGEKLGDGIEIAAEGAKKVYNTVADDDRRDRREEIIRNQDTGDTEWLP